MEKKIRIIILLLLLFGAFKVGQWSEADYSPKIETSRLLTEIRRNEFEANSLITQIAFLTFADRETDLRNALIVKSKTEGYEFIRASLSNSAHVSVTSESQNNLKQSFALAYKKNGGYVVEKIIQLQIVFDDYNYAVKYSVDKLKYINRRKRRFIKLNNDFAKCIAEAHVILKRLKQEKLQT